MSEPINLILTAKLLALVAPFMAKCDIRYYLNAINVRPAVGGGAIIVATDGHAIAYVLDREAVCDRELTIRVDGRAFQACAARAKDKRKLVLRNGRVAVVEHEDSKDEIYIQPGDPLVTFSAKHSYPDVFKLIPDPKSLTPGMAGSVNPYVIGKITAAATAAVKILSGGMLRDSSPMKFWTPSDDPNAVVVGRLVRFPDFFALLMPTRADDIGDPIPPCLAEAKKAHEKAQAERKKTGAEQQAQQELATATPA